MTNGEKIKEIFPYLESDKTDLVKVLNIDNLKSWWNAEYKEPTTKNETLVSLGAYKQVAWERDIAIEQLHELGYEFGQKIEPTTKNDLVVEDCISRKAVDDALYDYWHDIQCVDDSGFGVYQDSMEVINSVTPQEPKWIPVSERLPEEHICDDGFHEPSKSVLVQMKSGAMHTARYWSRYDERWLDLNYPTTDEVIAWMPLPKPYEPQESEKTDI